MKRRNKGKYLTWNSIRLLSLWKRPACQTLSKALDISSATAWIAPDLLKALEILSDTTVRRSAIDWEYLKPYRKSEKRCRRQHLGRNEICFISICKFVLLAYARILLQQLLACLYFTLESEELSFQYKWKSDFYALWQQHKQLKTMDMSEAWPDIFYEWYIHQFQSEPTHEIH